MNEDQTMDPDVQVALQQHYMQEGLFLLRSIRAMLIFLTLVVALSVAGTVIGVLVAARSS